MPYILDTNSAAYTAPNPFDVIPYDQGIISQVGPLTDAMREKRLNGVSRRVHGVFPSLKNARSMRWSTREQRDMMILLEVDPAVLS
jgi:hypothetical protein